MKNCCLILVFLLSGFCAVNTYAESVTLYDFETEDELKQISADKQTDKRIGIKQGYQDEFMSKGYNSLRIDFPKWDGEKGSQYNFIFLPVSINDWTNYDYVCFEAYSPKEKIKYTKGSSLFRFGVGKKSYDIFLEPGKVKTIKIPIASINMETPSANANIKKIRFLGVRMPQDTSIYIDNIRLLKDTDKTLKLKIVQPSYHACFFGDKMKEEIKAELNVKVKSPENLKLYALIESSDGKTIEKKENLAVEKKVDLSFKTPVIPLNGSINLKAVLLSENDSVISQVCKKIRHMPERKNITEILNGRTVVNGKPFFPIGMFVSGSSTDFLSELKKIGFNSTVWGMTAKNIEYSKECEKLGIMPQATLINDFRKKNFKAIEKNVEKIKDFPAVLAYNCFDEPTPEEKEAIMRGVALINDIDPYRLTTGNNNIFQDVYANTVDVMFVTSYPVLTPNSTFSQMFERITPAIKYHKGPVWLNCQGFSWAKYTGGSYKQRPCPSYDEIRSMAWLGIVLGCDGIYWYRIKVSGTLRIDYTWPQVWGAIVFTVKELNSLYDVLLAPDSKSELTTKNPDIHFRIKELNGNIYILAVNCSREKQTVNFSSNDLKNGEILVVSEKRKIPLKDGSFNDVFNPKETHIYTTNLNYNNKLLVSQARSKINKILKSWRESQKNNVASINNKALIKTSFKSMKHTNPDAMVDGWKGTFTNLAKNGTVNIAFDREYPLEKISIVSNSGDFTVEISKEDNQWEKIELSGKEKLPCDLAKQIESVYSCGNKRASKLKVIPKGNSLLYEISAYKEPGSQGTEISREKKIYPDIVKESESWPVLFEDDFKRKDIGKNWKVIKGRWKISDNALEGGHGYSQIQLVPKLPAGDIRVEFECRSRRPGDMSCIISGKYNIQFGADDNTETRIKIGGITEKGSFDDIIKKDKKHKVIIVRKKDIVSFSLDGKNNLLVAEDKTFAKDIENNIILWVWNQGSFDNFKVKVRK